MDGNGNRYKNSLSQDGLLYIANYLLGNIEEKINYIAVGDSKEQTTVNTKRLGNERFRKPFTDSYLNGLDPYFETFFSVSDANFDWKEMGLFAHGTEEKDSGILIARVLVNERKTNSKTASVTWKFRISNP
ncbi:hypothetical protein ACFIJ5_17915 (plasmid) [Haloimpatiens sp. FM7330]